mgnify:CR=1 FL=1
MKLTETEAKRDFDDVVSKAQSEVVRIFRDGLPVAAVISNEEFEQYQIFKEQQLKAAIEEGMADMEAGRIHDAEAVFEELRKRIS